MKILNAEQMREVDRLTTERCAIPSLQLMENAGAAIAEGHIYAVRRLLTPDLRGLQDPATRRVVILCGKGNNGGDGLVVARRLRERGASPRVLLFADPSSLHGDAAFNLKSWQQGHGELRVVTTKAEWDAARQSLAGAAVVVDALLGTGLKGPVEGLLADVIADVNAASGVPDAPPLQRPQVVAVDIPSGLASDGQDYGGPALAAHATVTLTAPKLGQIVSSRAACVGKLVVRGIGTPAALLDDDARLKMHWLEPGEFRALPLVRRRDANKGTFGHALIVAGSLGKSGAAVLAGSAALRAGAGLVTVATPSGVLPVVAASMPELMTAPLLPTESGSAERWQSRIPAFRASRAGQIRDGRRPRTFDAPETQQFIRTIEIAHTLLIVLDADGLNAFAGRADELAARRASLLAITPHPGEMARLLGVTPADVQAHRLEVALDAAKRWRAHVILKGFHTILATPGGDAFVNTTGNPGMATGGTGDVLTGLLAGLTAEFGVEHLERVLGLGVYLHGLAGDLAAARIGEIPLVASDLIDALPAAFAQLLEERSHAPR